MSLIDRLSEALDNRDKKWPTHDGENLDRKTVLSASEALRCLRHSWAEKHDITKDESFEEDWGFAHRGHGVEAYIVEALEKVMEDYEQLLYVGDGQVSFVDRENRVSGTPDGLYIAYTDDGEIEATCMIEIKSLDPRTNWDKLPKQGHLTQTNIGMALMNEFSGFTVDRCRLIYVDASQYTKQVEYVVDFDGGKAYENAKVRSKALFDANDMHQLPAEGAMSGGCKYCAYKTACGEATADKKYNNEVPAQVGKTIDTDDSADLLTVTARQYLTLNDRMKRDKELLDELKIEILNIMDGESEKDVAGMKIKASPMAGRMTLDRTAAEEKVGSLSAFEKVGSPSVRLSIKDI